MCITMHASEIRNTQIYAGIAGHEGKMVHVLAYQNKVKSKSILGKPVANAMILPIPAKSLSSKNAIDTRGFKSFLSDIVEATKHLTKGDRRLRAGSLLLSEVEVFDVGSYTVVLADSADQVAHSLELVPEEKRPIINDEVIESFVNYYPNSKLAICCWSGSIEPEPLLWWYEPIDPSVLFIPTLDAHGGSPQPGPVRLDHNICFGSSLISMVHPEFGSDRIRYKDTIPDEISHLLPKRVAGTQIKLGYNGDMYLPIINMENNLPEAKRRFPEQDVDLMGWY